MTSKSARKCYKYTKWLTIAGVILFFCQLYLAVKFFPSENGNGISSVKVRAQVSQRHQGDVSAKKYNAHISDDEDFTEDISQGPVKKTVPLNLEELDFRPACEALGKEAVSAVRRAKTQQCKRQIIDTACLIQNGHFYPKELPSMCPHGDAEWGRPLGCFKDEKKQRLLANFYGNYETTNTPQLCIDICRQAGFPYAGVQYSLECFCGETAPPATSLVDLAACNMPCSGDLAQICGGYFMMNIFETGVARFTPRIVQTPIEGSDRSARIVFLLTLNGRALRQVHRLINALYRSNHYFYIHIDSRQHYLHRELSVLESRFPNIRLAKQRFSTIWGGACLLEMLLTSMKDIIALNWKWDYVINLSESDFPIKSLDKLEEFLSANKGLNFVKSHGREVQRFIKKQGLDKTFLECDTHMWRIGDRRLPRGIVVDGGSDWIALSPEFVTYVVGEPDELLKGLHTIFKHTLLPAESFFHTVLRNSKFCNTYVDNNLHVTNWKRKLGCKCQYKHIVDWCGCSPNDFRLDDWPRIQNTQDRQLFFARKFEPVINQDIITRVEQFIGFTDLYEIENVDSYWQNIYHHQEALWGSDDCLLTHFNSIVRQNAHILFEELCNVVPQEIFQVNFYHHADTYKGNLILHEALLNDNKVLIETWYQPQDNVEVAKDSEFIASVPIFKVSSNFDQKEQTFRNPGNILGPLSEPLLQYDLLLNNNSPTNFTLVWLDPAGLIADISMLYVEDNNFTNFVKPNLKMPLLPGVWTVSLFDSYSLIITSTFLITPLELLSGKSISSEEVNNIHRGSSHTYKNYPFVNRYSNFLPNEEYKKRLLSLMEVNIHKLGADLIEWIDNLNSKFYKVLKSCIHVTSNIHNNYLQCGKHTFEICEQTKWSSLARDNKGSIGNFNNKTGRLNRT